MSAPRTFRQMCAQYGLDPDARRPTGESAAQAQRDRVASTNAAAERLRCWTLGERSPEAMARAVADFGPRFARLFFVRVIPGPETPAEAALDRSAVGMIH